MASSVEIAMASAGSTSEEVLSSEEGGNFQNYENDVAVDGGARSSQQKKEQAKEMTKKALDRGKGYLEKASERGHGFTSTAKEKAVTFGEISREKAKEAGRGLKETASDFAHDKDAQSHVATTAGKFLGAMRGQGGGIGQEAEAFGHGVQMVGVTVEKTLEHVPEEAKETLARGGKKLAETTDRIWHKVFVIVEKALDYADRKFVEAVEEDTTTQGDVEQGGTTIEDARPASHEKGPSVPLLGLGRRKKTPAEVEEKRKQSEKRQGTVNIVSKVVGGVILLLLLAFLLFLLGFLLLPVLLIALLVMLLSFQCWARCGVGASS